MKELVCFDCTSDEPCEKHAAEKRAAAYGRKATVQWASTIRPRRQVWLWEKRIPMGTASALAGRGGTGKTTYAFHLIAQLSLGTLPGRYYGDPRPSLIWSGEDQWDKVIVPRLIAAGADLTKVGRLAIDTYVDGETQEVTPRVPMDTSTITDMIRDTGAVATLIDPIASTMNGDLNREADVRMAVDALARVAETTDSVVMFVRHFGKGGGHASDKMSGSHAFRDAVRSVFLFAADDDRVIVTQDKGNYAPPGEESFAFRLDNIRVDTDDGVTEVARVIELGSSDTSVGDVINRTERDGDSDTAEVDAWLSELLANGPVKATDVYSAADAAGHSKDQAKRAKKRLGIIADRPANPGPWFWSLPKAGSSEQGAPPDSLPVLPVLPARSEDTEQGAHGGREQSASDRSLLAVPTPALMPANGQPPVLISARRTRTRGKFRPPTGPGRCPDCGHHLATMGHADICASKQETA